MKYKALFIYLLQISDIRVYLRDLTHIHTRSLMCTPCFVGCCFVALRPVGCCFVCWLLFCCFTTTVNRLVMSVRFVILTTLFPGRFRPSKRLTSTNCTYLRQQLITFFLNQWKETPKYVAGPVVEPRTSGLRHTCYRLRNAAVCINDAFCVVVQRKRRFQLKVSCKVALT